MAHKLIRSITAMLLATWPAAGLAQQLDLTAGTPPDPLDWPMFQHDQYNSGWAPQEFVNPQQPEVTPAPAQHNWWGAKQGALPTVRWKQATAEWANVFTQPVVVGDTVYMAVADGLLRAYDIATGKVKWSYNAAVGIGVTPAVKDGKLVCGDFAGNIFCLEAATGRPLWRFATRSAIYSSPCVVGNAVFIGSNDRHLYALHLDSGSLFWKYPTGGKIFSSPAVLDGNVHFASEDLFVHCVRAADGSVVWKRQLPGGDFARQDHPAVEPRSRTVLYANTPAWQGISFFNTAGGEHGIGWKEIGELKTRHLRVKSWLDLALAYYQKHPQRRSIFLLDADTGEERTGFTFPEFDNAASEFPPLSIRYGNTIRPMVHIPSGRYVLGAQFRGYANVTLDPQTRQIRTLPGFLIRGDENGPQSLSGRRIIETYNQTVSSLHMDSGRIRSITGFYNTPGFLDEPLLRHVNLQHWVPSTGDANSCLSGQVIVARGLAFYPAAGWLYCWEGQISLPDDPGEKEVAP
jgi:outer membrane protein assembly factor BamB